VTTAAEDVSFTELIQHPTRTTGRLATTRALRLRRRDADDLVLMSAGRAQQEGEVIDLTTRILAALLREPGTADLVRRVMPDVLPWMRFLPADAVDELVSEFIATGHAAVTLDNLAPISQMLAEWRHTAEIYADPELHAILSSPHEGDFGPVPRPDAVA
jgi:hypothetical protein